MNKDLEFLAKLDKKLYIGKNGRITEEDYTQFPGNFTEEEASKFAGENFPLELVADYTQSKMTEEEITKTLNITLKKEFFIYPISVSKEVGYRISKINKGFEEILLRFLEFQLPNGFSFNTISEYFMTKDNLTKAKKLNKRIVNSKSHYSRSF